jgi:D-glycero-D-manno-heptose 1,7-bisphosphate phosphatase
MSNKAVFLDRDKTLIEDTGYINSPTLLKILPGVVEALKQLKKMGYMLVVVTNQSGVARGIIKIEMLDEIHQKLTQLFAHKGVYLDRIYHCPFHPDGVIPEYRKESELRKPNPGMILKAAKEMDIDLSQSWMVGDSYRDIAAGKAANCRTILLNFALDQTYRKPQDPVPDKEAVNIKEVVNIIKMFERENKNNPTSNPKPTGSPTPKADKPKKNKSPKKDKPAPPAAKPIPASLQSKSKTDSSKTTHNDKTHQLLEETIRHLKVKNRTDMFEDFSVMKLIAGVVQIGVLFCLVLSICFLMDQTRNADSVHTAIGYAIALQLMAIAFYIMRDQK